MTIKVCSLGDIPLHRTPKGHPGPPSTIPGRQCCAGCPEAARSPQHGSTAPGSEEENAVSSNQVPTQEPSPSPPGTFRAQCSFLQCCTEGTCGPAAAVSTAKV